MPPSSAPAGSEARCRNCLLPDRVRLLHDFYPIASDSLPEHPQARTITLDAEGLCPFCRLYAQHYDQAHLRQELFGFIGGVKHAGQPVLVALSGGKDSLSALFLLVKVLQLPARAFTFDNGFIPAPVLAQTGRICETLGVPWEVVRRTLKPEFQAEYQRDAQGLLQARTGLDFCQLCASHIRDVMVEICLRDRLEYVVFGNKSYTSLEPRVSCIKQVPTLEGPMIQTLNLLFALGTDTTQQQNMLTDMGWQDPGLTGYTSNCLIPGLVAAARERRLGLPSDAGYIELELRSGAYRRDEAEALLAQHAQSGEIPPDQLDAALKAAGA